MNVASQQRNRFLLWVGILFLPIVFAWVTLRKNEGFSAKARVISLTWMALWLIPFVGRLQSPSTSSAPVSALSAPAKPQDHATAVAEAREFWKATVGATKSCDDIANYVTKSMKAGDRQTLYENAKGAQNNCLIGAEHLDNIVAPTGAPDNVQAALKAAIKEMSNSYTEKSQSYGQLAEMTNNGLGTSKPSEFVDLRKSIGVATYTEMMGVAKVADAFKLEGVSMQEYSGTSTTSHKHHHA